MSYTTYNFQRSIRQGSVLTAGLGVIIFAACPPLGIPFILAGYLMQRHFTKARRLHEAAARRRAIERADQIRILAARSLR